MEPNLYRVKKGPHNLYVLINIKNVILYQVCSFVVISILNGFGGFNHLDIHFIEGHRLFGWKKVESEIFLLPLLYINSKRCFISHQVDFISIQDFFVTNGLI